MSQSAPFEALRRVLLCIVDEAGEAISQQQFPAVRFRFGQQWQECISHLGCDFFSAENSEGLSKIENLRDGWRLFQAPSAQRLCQTRHSRMKLRACIGSPHGNDFRFPLRGGMLYAKIENAPADYFQALLKSIVGLEIPILRLEGKWKVNQNRTAAERAGAVAGLRATGCPVMADLISERSNKPK